MKKPFAFLALILVGLASLEAQTASTTIGAPAVPVTIPAPVPGAVPPSDLGASLTAAQQQTAYQQYLALRNQLLEQRRQAVIAASQVPDGPARWKIFANFIASQKDQQAELRQLHAESVLVERATQAAQATLEGHAVVTPKKLQ